MPTIGPHTVIPAAPTGPTDTLAVEYRDYISTDTSTSTTSGFGTGPAMAESATQALSITIAGDSIDETTYLGRYGPQVMLGPDITLNMSSVAPGTIATRFADAYTFQPFSFDALGGSDWYRDILGDIATDGFAGVMLVQDKINSLFVDQDAGTEISMRDMSEYYHSPMPDNLIEPHINDIPAEFRIPGSPSHMYSYPSPWTYDIRETYSMFQKYGFEYWAVAGGGIQSDVTKYHLSKDVAAIANLLVTGIEERQNIRKVTQTIDYRRNYELLTTSEQEESTSIVSQIIKTSVPSTRPTREEDPEIAADTPADFETIADSTTTTTDTTTGGRGRGRGSYR